MSLRREIVQAMALFMFVVGTAALAETTMECKNGQYIENGKAVPGGNWQCERHPGWDAMALAIDVARGIVVTVDNPPCGNVGDSDQAIKTLVGAVAAYLTDGTSVPAFAEMWDKVVAICSQNGGDLAKLCRGGAGVQNYSQCQAFAMRSPVRVERLKLIELRAAEGGRGGPDWDRCLYTTANSRETSGRCAINWSAWESLTVSNNLVGAVFKNWSGDRMRTGQMWLWY